MIEQAYQVWADHYCKLFGLSGEGPLEMLLEWAELFRLGGYSPAELVAATDWLALNGDPGAFFSARMQALSGRMKDQRSKDRPAPPDADPRGTCADCGGTGQVIVPDARVLHKWPDVIGGTCAVLCHCPLGKWLAGQNKRGQMTLEQYQDSVCSYWRELMQQKQDFLKQRARVQQAGPHWDATVKRTLQGLKAKQAALRLAPGTATPAGEQTATG